MSSSNDESFKRTKFNLCVEQFLIRLHLFYGRTSNYSQSLKHTNDMKFNSWNIWTFKKMLKVYELLKKMLKVLWNISI